MGISNGFRGRCEIVERAEAQIWFAAIATVIGAYSGPSESDSQERLRRVIFGDGTPYSNLKVPCFQELTMEKLLEAYEALQSGHVDTSTFLWEVIDPAIYAMVITRRTYFLITKEGSFGFSARPTTPGDRICYIPGAKLLHILSVDCDQYVAAACIDDLMGDSLLSVIGTESRWTTVSLR